MMAVILSDDILGESDMPQAFLPATLAAVEIDAADTPEAAGEPQREKVRLLVIGSRAGCDRVIHELYRVGFAEVREWSQPLPTGTPGQTLRILTRWLIPES